MSNISRDVKSGQSSDLILSSLNGNAAASLLLALIEEEPKTLEAKIDLLTQLKQCCEALECDLDNKTTFLHWTAIASGFATAAVLCGTTALNPLIGFLVAATSGASAVATVSGSVLHNKEATKTIEKLKRLQLVLKSDETINWACLWGLGGFSLFCEAIHEATKGNLTDFEIIRKNKLNALTVAAKFVAQSKGIQLDVLVAQLTEIKTGKRSQLEEDLTRVAKTVLQQPVIEPSAPPQPITNPPVAEAITVSTTNAATNFQPPIPTGLPFSDQMHKNAWDILQGLVKDADKSKLGGCVILAAPGAGKTTYLGTAWGRLKKTYGERFTSLAIIVKHDDLEAFQGVSDDCLVVEDSPRQAAIAILRFVESCKRKDNNIRRLFLDDFLTMNEFFKAALGGLYINPDTFNIVLTRKEDYDAQPMLITLYSALNKLWLVGRENNAALWVSSHSSNVEDLPFAGSKQSRSVGTMIFLAKNDKRDFIEQTINNPNLIGDNSKRQEVKALLNSIDSEVEEPLVLANSNNWTFGIVSTEVHEEYQNCKEEWRKVQPVLKPGEKLSDIINGLEKSFEISGKEEEVEKAKEVKEVKEVKEEIDLSDAAYLINEWLEKNRVDIWVKFKGKKDRDASFVNFLSGINIKGQEKEDAIGELVLSNNIELSEDGCSMRWVKEA